MTYKDIKNKKFGGLIAIKYLFNNKFKQACWLFRCKFCNKTTQISYQAIKRRKDKSCGCLNPQIENISKEKFNKLTAIKFIEIKNHKTYWLFKCDCNNKIILDKALVKLGRKKSCGCFRGNERHYNKSWTGCGEISGAFFSKIKNSAKKRNIEFNISIEYIWNLFLKQNRKCVYSNLELKFNSGSLYFDGTASLDRIDSSKGYIKGNLQWIHKNIQSMKMNKTEKEFLSWCNKISNFRK